MIEEELKQLLKVLTQFFALYNGLCSYHFALLEVELFCSDVCIPQPNEFEDFMS
jgi:hypothetical protein